MSLAIRGNDFNFFFSANDPKIELVDRKWTSKSTLLAKLTSVIWPFWVSKKSFSGLFQSFLELFRNCLGIVLGLRRPTFGCIFSSKGPLMTPKIDIFCQKFAHFGGFEGSFLTILEVKKVDFWTFSKLFWTCLGSVWAFFWLQRAYSWVYSELERSLNDLEN